MPEILLVDDGSQVLTGLRRGTHLGRDVWTLGWALDAAGALEYLASHQVDVLVADAQAPGVAGGTLLEQARQRFPDTARIVLSDGRDRNAVISAAGNAQQFLPKLSDATSLIAALDSVLTARALVQDAHLRSVLGGLDTLPRPAAIYAELVALAGRSDSTVREIAELVERDLATTADLLKLVNSSLFALPNEVTSVQRAVTLLGLNVIQTLVLAGQAFRSSRALPPGLVAADLAAQGLRASLEVRRNLGAAGWPEQVVGELSIAALLFDVGLLSLAANQPESWKEYTRLRAVLPLSEAQVGAFGCTLGRASGYVLGLWGFHANVVSALAEQPLDLDDELACSQASPAAVAVAQAHRVAAA